VQGATVPIERQPVNPLPPGYMPPGGRPYRVKTHDDLVSIATAHGIRYHDLVTYNFATADPAEINWYLRRKVGCTRPTHDLKNWMFTSDAQPGVIYLPPPGNVAAAAKNPPTQLWFGIGGQTGGHLAIAGKDTVEACVYSADSYQNRFWLNIDGYRLGPGLGGSIGAVVVVISHLSAPHKLQGFKLSEWDFQAAMLGKWGDFAKEIKAIKMIQRFSSAGRIIDKTMTLLEYERTREAILTSNEIRKARMHALEESEQPDVSVIPIPLVGLGAELSVYRHWGSIFVHHSTFSPP
jgi:hypothetical protein